MNSSAVLLGLLQGLFEWLPVSSEGAVTAAFTFLNESPLSEGVSFALWLHIGTVPCVLVVFRSEIFEILKGIVTQPTKPSPLILYLVISTLVSGLVGLPLILTLSEASELAGNTAMGLIGALLLITGAVQLRRRSSGVRGSDDLRLVDGLLAGIAQGFAVLPGLSRSGLTVAVLLGRGLDRREALVLSFLMSVPAGIGATLYAGLDTGFGITSEKAVAALVAFVVGLVTIKALTELAGKVNFGVFVLIAGAAMLIGALWQVSAA